MYQNLKPQINVSIVVYQNLKPQINILMKLPFGGGWWWYWTGETRNNQHEGDALRKVREKWEKERGNRKKSERER
jgi:hypothetical protein